ncbi:MAG TPA: alcohol dehydrogenase catalytic domain-containing protein [Stellaceae bacterium]|nr:alcohol dehydrogenase catalytic domain-containing protein [Stellaceae bacterium]
MKALQKTQPAFGVELREVEPPRAPGPGEVLIEVGATGICGSDLHVCEWTGGYEFVAKAMPLTLGHEFAGRIVGAGGGVVGLPMGTRVTVLPSVVCGECPACRSGDPDQCANRVGLGMTKPGAFAPLVLAPAENCVALPEGVDDELAALTEPLTVGARAVEVGGVGPGDRVLVLGPGTIGQAIAIMAREAGAREVTIVGRDDGPRIACLRSLGFERAIDTATEPLESQLARLGGAGFDVVFEAVGIAATLTQGLALLRKGGVLVVAGIHPAPVTIDVTRMVRDQQQLRGTHRASRATWERVVRLLAEKGAAIRPMITHRVSLDQAVEGFELARRKLASKVIVLPKG